MIKANVNTRIYAFVSVNPDQNTAPINILQHIAVLEDSVNRFRDLIDAAIDQFVTILTEYSETILDILADIVPQIIDLIEDIRDLLDNFQFSQLPALLNSLTTLWNDGWKPLESNTILFIDSVRDNFIILQDNLTQELSTEIEKIENHFQNAIQNLIEDLTPTFSDVEGYGLHFEGSFDLLGLKILGLEIEVVYSIDALGQCSKFARAYSLLQGERAIRVYAGFSTGLVKYVHPTLRLLDEGGVGFGLAISLDNIGKFAAQIHAEVKILGIVVESDLLITNNGLYYYIEGNVWNIFKAQLTVFAEHDGNWNQLTFGIEAVFVANAKKKRAIASDDSFNDSYLSALRRFTQKIADEAEERISKLQDKVTAAQNGLTKAQNWLSKKQKDVQNANTAFDNAVQKLENAKDKLEDAKGPFEAALAKLNQAQKNVDNLCKIKTCNKICIPGVKWQKCSKKIWGKTIKYPCLKFTNCMISFPNPVCVAANALCRIARAAAYVALEVAKIFVRAPMLAFDLAKAAVSAAQFIVDKSRVVLVLAEAALELAKIGLEVAKKALDGAKLALEAVKQVVKLGFKALNFIIEFGIQSIIDVKNCGFSLTISTTSPTVFDVSCEVNLFKTGFKTVRIRINFTDIVQSIWNAAKATVKSALQAIGNIFSGRKRREIQHQTVYALYKHLRLTRDVTEESEAEFNETLNVIAQTAGFTNNTEGNDYEYRREVFEEKCQNFHFVHGFLSFAIQQLREMSNETASVILNTTNVREEIESFSNIDDLQHMTLEDIGIDPVVAENDFNISLVELTETIELAKLNMSNNEYLFDIISSTYEVDDLVQNQTDDFNNLLLVNHWLDAMENITGDYFDSELCSSFLDCAQYGIFILYDTFTLSDLPDKEDILDRISDIEDAILKLASNDSESVVDVDFMAMELVDSLDALLESNVFCSTPPTLLSELQNKTIAAGQTLQLVCNATGDPSPTFRWYKDGEIIDNETSMVLRITEVDVTVAGLYYCVASNLVADLASNEVQVTIIGKFGSVNWKLLFEAGHIKSLIFSCIMIC